MRANLSLSIFFPVITFLFFFFIAGCGKDDPAFSYQYLASGTNYDIQGILVLSPDTILMSGGDRFWQGFTGLSVDGGSTWRIDSVSNKELYHLVQRHNGRVTAVGYDGYYYESGDYVNWDFYRLSEWMALKDAVVLPDNHLVTVGGGVFSDGVIIRMTPDNRQDTFHKGLFYTLTSIAHVEGNTLVAVGFGAIILSEDGGRKWELLEEGGEFFQTVKFPSPKTGYAAGATGTILKTEDGGRTWFRLRNGNNPLNKSYDFRAMHFSSEQVGYLAGQNGVLWKTTNGGESWQKHQLGDYNFRALAVENDRGFVAGENGVLIEFAP